MKVPPWSFTTLEAIRTCPRQHYHIRVVRDYKDDKNEAALWGDRLHIAFAHYLTTGELDAQFSNYRPYLDKLLALPGDQMFVEKYWGIDRQQQACDPKSSEAWGRGIIDFAKVDGDVARVIDHKTGKPKPKSKQLIVFSLLTFAHLPEVQRVETSFEWIAYNQQTAAAYTREQIPDMWAQILPDLLAYRDAYKMDQWDAKPSGLCRGWCPVTGCEHWQPKKF